MHLYSDRLRIGLVTSLCHRCTPFTVRLTQTGSNRPDSEDKAQFKLRLAAVPSLKVNRRTSVTLSTVGPGVTGSWKHYYLDLHLMLRISESLDKSLVCGLKCRNQRNILFCIYFCFSCFLFCFCFFFQHLTTDLKKMVTYCTKVQVFRKQTQQSCSGDIRSQVSPGSRAKGVTFLWRLCPFQPGAGLRFH